jgi:hypothetical protein
VSYLEPRSAVALTGLLLSACPTEPSIAPPIVASFGAVPGTILRGDSTSLIWTVTGADSLALSPGVGVVTGTSVWVHPTSTTNYTLVAVNRAGRDSAHATVTVTLPPPPVITSFVASAETIVGGAASVLSWDVAGADTVRIDQGIGITKGTVLRVQPIITTTYTLTAVNAGGPVSATATVAVVTPSSAPPSPANFVARSIGGGGVLLSWSAVPTASSFSLEVSSNIAPTFQPLTTVGGSSYYVSDGTTTANNIYTYRLTAINAAGTSGGVTASSLSAPQPPEGPAPIIIVPASPVTVSRGEMLMFTANQPVSWIVLDGMGGGSITAGGVYTAPAGGGTFRIAAVGSVTNTVAVVVP